MRTLRFGWVALVLLVLGSVSTPEALAPSDAHPCRRGSIIQQRGQMCSDKQSLSRLRMVDQNRNDCNNNDDRSIEEVEREASRKVASRLMFSWNLQQAINTTAWTFVLVGFLLNLFGYDYVFNKENQFLRIDTIENKQFQQELVTERPSSPRTVE